MPARDVVVIGNGPAGIAAAVACAEAGLTVDLLAIDHTAPWPNTYGVWQDELQAMGIRAGLTAAWPRVVVATGAGPSRTLERPYGRIDNVALRDALVARFEAAGGRRVTGRAMALQRHDRHSTVVDASGASLPCRVVIDASGHQPVLLCTAVRKRQPAFQTAYGIRATFTSPPIERGAMVLMDYRSEPLRGAANVGNVARDPTFLYAMDLGDGSFFVEETCLAGRPPMVRDVLAARLAARLDAVGAQLQETLAVEWCRFPMGTPLPPLHQPVVGFGAAAGMVHPATGYSVGAALRRAPRLAAAVADALGQRDATSDRIAAAGWRAVWPADLVRQRALHRFGLEALLAFDTAGTQAFFDAFFSLPSSRVNGYVSGAPNTVQLLTTLLAVYRRAGPDLRRALRRCALGRSGLELGHALADSPRRRRGRCASHERPRAG